jgi:uncharacterized cupin superfamily protein
MKKMVLKSIVFTVALCGAGTVAAIMAGASMKPKAIVDLNPDALAGAELAEVQEYPFMRISEGVDPKSASVNAFGSADGQFDVGFYHGTEVTLSISNWPVSEVMVFLEGQVEITAVGGSPKIYGPGDALVMPKGFNGTWRQLSAIKKISVSYAGD